MDSRPRSVFLVSVAAGAIGISVAESISNGSNGAMGFIVGFLGTFTVLSILASISDIGKQRPMSATLPVHERIASKQTVQVQTSEVDVSGTVQQTTETQVKA